MIDSAIEFQGIDLDKPFSVPEKVKPTISVDAARNASVPQQPGALRSITGFPPQPVATPGQTGPNDERTLLPAG